MTTVEHRNAVYAYYFYRLIQRASSITLMYNTSSEGLNRGEMSRFMLQLLVESPHPIGRFYLEAGQSPRSQRTIVVEKSSETLRRMARRFDLRQTPDAVLSPSALNAYIDCPLKFYFRYVARVKTPDEISAEIDSALFGTIFHRSAEQVYRTLTANGQAVNRDGIDRLLRDTPRLQAGRSAFNARHGPPCGPTRRFSARRGKMCVPTQLAPLRPAKSTPVPSVQKCTIWCISVQPTCVQCYICTIWCICSIAHACVRARVRGEPP